MPVTVAPPPTTRASLCSRTRATTSSKDSAVGCWGRAVPASIRESSPLDGELRGTGPRRRYAVPPEGVAHQLGERRSGDRATATGAGVVDHHVDGEPGVVGRAEPDERRGVAA